MKKTPLEVLEAARDLIRDEKNWCQGRAYTDHHPTGGCALGAIALVNDDRGVVPMGAAVMLQAQAAPQTVSGFNDTHTHAEVLELFNLAIQAELAKQNELEPEHEHVIRKPVLSGAC